MFYSSLVIPSHIIKETLQIFQKYGEQYLEAMVLWAGNDQGDVFNVTDVIEPYQENTCIDYFIPADEVHKINLSLNKSNLMAIAQLHTHPGEAFHSPTDDNNTILNLPGNFSIVFPDYGDITTHEISRWVVYQLRKNSEWVHLNKKEVLDLFQIK